MATFTLVMACTTETIIEMSPLPDVSLVSMLNWFDIPCFNDNTFFEYSCVTPIGCDQPISHSDQCSDVIF